MLLDSQLFTTQVPSSSFSLPYVDTLRPVTSVPPHISLAPTYADAIMKQFMTLSLENWVFWSVLSINKNTKINVPVASETIAAIHLVPPSLPIIGETATWWQGFYSLMNIPRIAAKMPPQNCPAIYMMPSILLDPKLECFLNMNTIVTAGLKWAPEMATPNKVMTHAPKSMPAYF